jgi:hypothetical protein
MACNESIGEGSLHDTQHGVLLKVLRCQSVVKCSLINNYLFSSIGGSIECLSQLYYFCN